MKLLLIAGCLLLVAAVVRSDNEMTAYIDALKDEFQACATEADLSLENMQKLVAKDLDANDQHKVGCVKGCVLKKLKAWDGSAINADMLKDVVEKVHAEHPDVIEKEMKILHDCADKVSNMSDDCKVAVEYEKCYIDAHEG